MPSHFAANKTALLSTLDWSRLSFLLVEDNEDHQWLMSAVLRDTGVKVSVVGRGEDAIELVKAAARRNDSFDLILMDIRLPTIDGYETTRRVRAVGYSGPIVAITARAMEGEIEECHRAGCNACISKPFDRATLRETLNELLPRTVSEN